MFEVHPELCLWAMNGQQPMPHSKKTVAGKALFTLALAANTASQALLAGSASFAPSAFWGALVAGRLLVSVLIC